MKTVRNSREADPELEQTVPAVLRQGFRHPRGHRRVKADERGQSGPSDISDRACTWDT